ncbi:hypothetical protein P4O66_013614, partial [Electrophorus voltai]
SNSDNHALPIFLPDPGGSAACSGMDEKEQNRYVAQLKEEFDSCDTTGTGYLDKEELTALCYKLSLGAHLPLLLDSLLGPQHYARINFEEFKEGFVAVLSRSLDVCTSEEESSYFESAAPEEVKPKFVKGTKRYGRRSQPDKAASLLTADNSEDSPLFGMDQDETLCPGGRQAKLRRSASLESVESLKSDEDPGSNKHSIQHYSEAQGQLKCSKPDSSESPRHSTGPSQEVTDGQVRAVWEELGVGSGGSLNKQELSLVCDHIGLKDLQSEELDALFRKLDKDQDGRVSLSEFQSGLFRHEGLPAAPAASTPARLQTKCSVIQFVMSFLVLSQAFEERVERATSPSLLSATVGQRLLTRLDDGSGYTTPERVVALWTEEGIRNSKDILQVRTGSFVLGKMDLSCVWIVIILKVFAICNQCSYTLDFSLEERLSLAELALALDNELLVSGNGIHQAALISYKDEIQFLHGKKKGLVHQACQERDKAKADLELTDRHNLQLIREIDDHHATMESLNESKVKDLEQDFRDKLTALRSETERDNETLLQQAKREQAKLNEEVALLKAQEGSLKEEATTTIKENSRLEEEISDLKGRLSESESTISKLRRDLDHVLQDKYGDMDPNSGGLLSPEERLSGIIKEYELQCRALDDSEMKRGTSPLAKKGTDKNALGSMENLVPTLSIETELAMEQLKEQYEQEIQDLKIQLETKVNFYERTIELMKQNMEVERKEIAQGYKVEISELEEQKALADKQLEQVQHTVQRLERELKTKGERMVWGPKQEQQLLREQAELEQNYAREIGNIVHRLTAERDQLEAELKLKMDQEVLHVREEMEQQLSQTKAQYREAHCSFLHQLQEQTEYHCKEIGAWEARVHKLEQEVRREHLLSVERLGEEQAQICSNAAQEGKKLEEEHHEEVRQLRECIGRMQAEAEVESRVEEELLMLQRQLEDNTVTMKAQDALIQNLTSELHSKEREMERGQKLLSNVLLEVSQLEHKLNLEQEMKRGLLEQLSQQKLYKNKEEEFLAKLSQLEQRHVKDKKTEEELLQKLCQFGHELESIRTESETLQKEKERMQGNFSRLSSAFDNQQTQLKEQEREIDELKENLGKTHEALMNRDEYLSLQASELRSVEMDRVKLREELRDQGIVLNDFQTQVQRLSADWDQRNGMVQNLHSALSQEQNMVSQLETLLNLEQEEKRNLLHENSSYSRLSDQLSSQIVEMEAESVKLQENIEALRVELQHRDNQVHEFSSQLEAKTMEMDLLWNEVHQKMDLIQNVSHLSGEVKLLTSLLEDKEKELCSLREEADNTTNQFQQSLMDSQADVQRVEEAFEWEKGQMKEQLLEMERLVMALEMVMDPASPHRAQLDEVNSENSALKDRLVVLHQDVARLEEEVNKKRQNSECREQVLDLSARNLQLSNENAELNSRLRTYQGEVQRLSERLAQVWQEQKEAANSIRQLQETTSQLEREKLQLNASRQQEKAFLENELKAAKDKLQHLTDVESALTSLTLKNQLLQKDNEELLKESEEKNKKLEKLQDCINTLEMQAEQLHSQLNSVQKEKDTHVQDMATHYKLLKESQDKVVDLEASIHELCKERAQLQQVHRMQEEAAASALQEELRSMRVENQELLQKVANSESKMQTQEMELQKLMQKCVTFKNKQEEMEIAKNEAEEQAFRANAVLSLSQAQHVHEMEKMRDQVDAGNREHLAHLQAQLAEQQSRTQQLDVQLCSQAQHAKTQLGLQQKQYEKVMEDMQERMEELEVKLKSERLMLQEKVNQFKEQIAKNVKSDLLLKDLYMENSQLMKALQVTEQRQKSSEKKSFLLEEKVNALNKLLHKIAPASLSV